jgi:6-phosphogluconolactonase
MPMNKVKIFDNADELSHAVARLIVELSLHAIQKTGRFSIALSGGTTPSFLYNLLAHLPYSKQLDWKNIFIFWSDERCVPADDERSNTNMARKMMLDHVPAPAENIFSVQVQMTPMQAAVQYEQMLKAFFREEVPVFDLILLGMGTDGHTASLFPDTDILNKNTALISSVYKADENIGRISFTPLLINNAKHILLLVTGGDKADILKEVLEKSTKAIKYPVQMIHPEKGKIEWYIDKTAASRLKKK